MKRYSALLKETWWLWVTLIPLGCVMGVMVSPVFFITIPICFVAFVYFGIMRYTEDGKHKGDLGD